jgi:NAD(P)-dependent dehydrogenase (short-subunit alcohol dehydrogenase family)
MKSIQELANLTGRTALVTGGGGHIGSEICSALAELGADVVVLDADAEACQRVAQNLVKEHGVRTLDLPIDLSKEEQVLSVPDRVLESFTGLDILINNAALVGASALKGWAVPFAQQSTQTWRMALEVNLTAPFVLVQSCTELLRQSGRGCIINVASIYGLVGPDDRLYEGTRLENPAAYSVSKGGLLQFTRWLATVLAPDIRVNSITPGGVWRNQPEEFRRRYEERTPLKRMATEEDLKGGVAYLASDLSAYVTGQNLVVDGGWTAW